MGYINFADSIDGDFAVSLPSLTSAITLPDQVSPVIASMVTKARLTPRVGPIPGAVPPQVIARATGGLVLTAPTPVVIAGKPRVPRFSGQIAVSGAALSGPGHFRGLADPDPIWDGSEWTTPPPDPPAGANFIRWTVRDLPDPAGFTDGFYLLGHRVTDDATDSLPSGCERWDPTGGSDFNLPWYSAWPFKPRVQSYIHYGEDGNIHTETAAVYLHPHRLAHMWADLGTVMTPPFTMLIVCIQLDFPARWYMNYVFDAGYDPTPSLTTAQRSSIWRSGLASNISISEAEGYRNGMRVGRRQMQVFTDPSPATRIGRIPFTHTLKPKMMAMVVDGSHSTLNVFDSDRRLSRPVTLVGHGAQRLWLMGRANGSLNPNRATSMAVFEIRAWDKALDRDHLEAQYAQLSTTWKFHNYDRQQIRNNLRALS